MMRTTEGSAFSLACSDVRAAESAEVSWPFWRAAISGIGSRLDVPNGLANMVAFSTGALAGRNLVLSLCVTLDRLGSRACAAMAPMIQVSAMIQRNRTLNRPRALKMASTFMGVSVVDQGCHPVPASRP